MICPAAERNVSPQQVSRVGAVTNLIDLKCFKFLRWNSMTNSHITEKHYSIQEVARLSGLPESTLRYYESVGLLAPIARDLSSGHRRYTEADLDATLIVACLNATGMGVQDMRAYLQNRSVGAAMAADQIELLSRQVARLEREAAAIALRQAYLGVKVAYWQALAVGDTAKQAQLRKQADAMAAHLRNQDTYPDKQEAA